MRGRTDGLDPDASRFLEKVGHPRQNLGKESATRHGRPARLVFLRSVPKFSCLAARRSLQKCAETNAPIRRSRRESVARDPVSRGQSMLEKR
jgi:hypothetical protein